MYETQEEAVQKLSNCIVLFNGQPTFIQSAKGHGPKLQIYHQTLRDRTDRIDLISDKGFDFRTVGSCLGYMNYNSSTYKEALYLTRIAVRKSHSTQGLSQFNMKVPPLRGSEKLGLSKQTLSWQSIYTQPFLLDTLERKYPTLAETEQRFKKDNLLTSLAFNKQFAVRAPRVGPFFLEYRSRDIGYTDDFFRWKIGEEFKYLGETLEMLNLKVA